eukprot:TRINITY_DN120742_c0_g1_i1.p1 TRINITY_DN120742_c0_g1~~TRINITY_DN120742_c0_g1_i1.p1  ORF type:complete len:453 (-),score=42.22 TRINITY_DN120742_c0_g1_i1:423-1781(-)
MGADTAACAARACLLQSRESPAFYRHGVLVLACAFFGVFSGFNAAQGLQTSVNSTLGYINLASLYSVFCVLSIAAPRIACALEGVAGMRAIFVVAAFVYALLALSNIDIDHWAVPISMNVLAGIAAPLLWTCQNEYVGRCAYQAAKFDAIACDDAQDLGSLLVKRTAEFNGLFFSIYQLSGGTGNIVASGLMLAFADKKWLKTVLFAVLAMLTSTGAMVFLRLPTVGREVHEVASTSLKATVALAFGDKRVALLVPLIFTSGMLLACAVGSYATDIICPVLGADFTGFVVATFFAVNSSASFIWGQLIKHGKLRRRAAYVLSGMMQLSFLLFKFWWQRPSNYVNLDGVWVEVATPTCGHFALVFAMVALLAAGDAFWESGPPGTLQSFFANTPHSLPAMANLKMWHSFGFAVQSALGEQLGDAHGLRDSILAALVIVSILGVVMLSRMAPLP